MEQYSKLISSLAQEKVNRVFINNDEEYALAVLVQLFKSAESTIRIFAGCLCDSIGDAPEYIEALSDFIENKGELYILLNKYDKSKIRESNLFKRFAYYISEGYEIHVKKTSARPYFSSDKDKKEIHFTIADEKGYRIETDMLKKTAECNFNNKDVAKIYVDFFDKIFNDDVISSRLILPF